MFVFGCIVASVGGEREIIRLICEIGTGVGNGRVNGG